MQSDEVPGGFWRHLHACRNAVIPGGRTRLTITGETVGWVLPALAGELSTFDAVHPAPDGALEIARPEALQDIARTLAGRGRFRWRGEAFDVRARADGTVLGRIDRGALPAFGVMANGVHVNGLVCRADGLHLWVARRAAARLLDPGKLDHITAGGVSAGHTPEETLIKEAAEEAAIPEALAATAVPVGRIGYAMERAEGLRRDLLHCFDLKLPETFTPSPADGESDGFELWPIERAFATVRDTDQFKFNVNLVLIDLFIREGLIAGPGARDLRDALASGSP